LNKSYKPTVKAFYCGFFAFSLREERGATCEAGVRSTEAKRSAKRTDCFAQQAGTPTK
jgi:hypothetical protein